MNLKYYPKFWLAKAARKQIVTHRFPSVLDLNINFLKQNNIKLIIFDVDDTLTGHLDKVDSEVKEFLKNLIKEDFKISLYSNCSKLRHIELKEMFKEFFYYHVELSSKPDPKGYIEVLNHFKISDEQTAMVGDKIATDLFGAYLAGIKFRVLVSPFSEIFKKKKANIFHRLLRFVESI